MLTILSIVTPAGRVLARKGDIADWIAGNRPANVEILPYRGFHAAPNTAQMVVAGF